MVDARRHPISNEGTAAVEATFNRNVGSNPTSASFVERERI